jgi:hypothetical protein
VILRASSLNLFVFLFQEGSRIGSAELSCVGFDALRAVALIEVWKGSGADVRKHVRFDAKAGMRSLWICYAAGARERFQNPRDQKEQDGTCGPPRADLDLHASAVSISGKAHRTRPRRLLRYHCNATHPLIAETNTHSAISQGRSHLAWAVGR